MLNRQYADLSFDAEQIAEDTINEVAIGGEFLSHPHTLEHFKENMWQPSVLSRAVPSTLSQEKDTDTIANATAKIRAIRSRDDLYVIDEHKGKAIDDIVERAATLLD